MGLNAAQWLLLTWIATISFAAGYVAARWRWASPATRPKNAKPLPAPTPPSEGTLAQMQADQVALFSAVEKIANTVKRISSRHAMQETRAQDSQELTGSKADMLRKLGMAGKVGPQFAQAQLEYEANQRTN